MPRHRFTIMLGMQVVAFVAVFCYSVRSLGLVSVPILIFVLFLVLGRGQYIPSQDAGERQS